MARKQWTPKITVDESIISLREKRKWQIALRRYVLEKNKSSFYAPYFGLDQDKFRQWIEVQFDDSLSWDNFSEKWQFDHVVPLSYFDFTLESDLRLCWSFINIRVNKIDSNSFYNRVDVLAAKAYFEELFRLTRYGPCEKMIEKIKEIERDQLQSISPVVSFLNQNEEYLAGVQALSSDEFDRLNGGTALKSLLYEKEFLKKFGS